MQEGQEHELVHSRAARDAVTSAAYRLRDRGERVTDQRLAMLEVLASRADYLSADDLAGLVQHAHPHFHRATVYRTLDLFVELGLVSRLPGNNGASVYHLAALTRAHEHLHGQCLRCRTVVNLPSDAFASAFSRLLPEFQFDPEQSALFGLCANCADAN